MLTSNGSISCIKDERIDFLDEKDGLECLRRSKSLEAEFKEEEMVRDENREAEE